MGVIELQFDMESVKLLKHVYKVCKPNIRRNAKICRECPFRGLIDGIMDGIYQVGDKSAYEKK